MSEPIQDGKFVELTYQVADKQSGHVLTSVEFPLGYVHGHNEILAPSVHKALEGRCAGDVIEVPIDGNRIFGPRDESLVFTDRLDNVPDDYRQVGTSILMENDKGETLNGRWIIYFAGATNSGSDPATNNTHRIFAITANTSDPLGSWTFFGRISDSTNQWAIDPTVFFYNKDALKAAGIIQN